MSWQLPETALWKSGLGEDLCIIDLDDRRFNLSGQIFGPHVMSWQFPDSVHGLSLGILNHWLYSKSHLITDVYQGMHLHLPQVRSTATSTTI